ncbi:MAG: hypothetical protein FJ034_05680, partial [Chloroflexi bacterium]|nr:hypothetical protein [Chloroflexota bacterium]
MRILVATDLSPSASEALELCRTAPWPEDSAVRVLAAVEPHALTVAWDVLLAYPEEEERLAVERTLRAVADR